MALESIADVEKLHAEFVKSINTTATRLLRDDRPNPSVLLDGKRQLLADLGDRLRAATDARTEAVRLYDRQITQLENAIKSIEGELKDDERVIRRITRSVGKKAQAKRAGGGRKMRSK